MFILILGSPLSNGSVSNNDDRVDDRVHQGPRQTGFEVSGL